MTDTYTGRRERYEYHAERNSMAFSRLEFDEVLRLIFQMYRLDTRDPYPL